MLNRSYLLIGIIITVIFGVLLMEGGRPAKQLGRDIALPVHMPDGRQVSKTTNNVKNLPDFRHAQFINLSDGWLLTLHSIWKTVDGGKTFEDVYTSPQVNTVIPGVKMQQNLRNLHFVDQHKGWVIEGNNIISTVDSGKSWKRQSLDPTISLGAFYFLDEKTAWLVGTLLASSKEQREIDSGVVFSTSDGGQRWDLVPLNLDIHSDWNWHLTSVWCSSPNDIWVVGSAIIHSFDRGQSWSFVEMPNSDGVHGSPARIKFADSQIGWITTNQPGGYWVTFDGGKSWATRRSPRDNTCFINDLIYLNDSEVWAISGSIYRSIDSGKTWSEILKGNYSILQYKKEHNMLFLVEGNKITQLKLRV